MGLIRLIILALVIWMFWRVVKNFQARQSKKSKKETPSGKREQSNMVLCQFCSVHVPEQDAISHEKSWFCSERHKEKYLAGDQ